MNKQVDEERAARVRQARQVLAGNDLAPADDPLGFGPRVIMGGSGEFRYLVGLAVLVVLATIVWLIWGMGPASLILLILAFALLAGWFVL
ncbi:MAG: hypothetical protein M3464_10435 [Chloroflexota bacterium]|nr:hypothetical protein [Chloroflexota bacterium]